MNRPGTNTLVFIGLCILVIIARMTGMFDFFSLETMQAHHEQLHAYVDQSYALSAVLFVCLYTLLVAFGIPVTIPLTIMSGFLFGIVIGTALSALGTVIGSVACVIAIRYFIREAMQKKYGERFKHLINKVNDHGPFYVLVMHYLAVIPFFIINTVAALTQMSLTTFAGLTVLGAVPIFLGYTYMGKKLATLESVNTLYWPFLILACILFVLMVIIPRVSKRFSRIKK